MRILLHLNKKNIFLSLFLAFFVLGVFGMSLELKAAGVNEAVEGLNISAGEGFLGKGRTIKPNSSKQGIMTDIPSAIGKVIGAGLTFIGLLFFILIIYGGFLWMTARGNDTQVTKSIDLMTQAIVGLLIVSGAYLLTKFVGQIIIGGM